MTMVKDTLEILVPLTNGKSTILKIKSSSNNSLFLMEGADAVEGEAPNQLVEGKFYDFKIGEGYTLIDSYGIVSTNKFDKSIGRISPNIYVGTLSLNIVSGNNNEVCGSVKLEVQSVKTSYRKDYRKMLSDITKHCIELIFLHSSPVTQVVDIDYERDPKTIYQQFAFVKSVLDTDEFINALHKVISSPVTKWAESEIDKDIRGAKRLNKKSLRQIVTESNRINLPEIHPLKEKLDSIPSKLKINYKRETVDTPENRFIKHALKTFLSFIIDIKSLTKDQSKIYLEAEHIEDIIEQFLSYAVFKDISEPTSILLNSPVLQRKEGYREIFKIWLMFHLAAQLTWSGGDDVYEIGKRDVAVLYEYWLFFQLLKIIEKVFGIKPGKNLIVDTNDTLGLQLKQGTHFPVEGICDKYNRKLRIQFSYNRTFSGNKEYPKAGSWTRNMRPDYTLSIWPEGIDVYEAEREELIVHIHFDAKYKIENILDALGENVNLDEEKAEQKKGTYKRADLLKMHSYKDAIRRTGGAYILYPGKDNTKYNKMGFREIIPGLGAFQIRPSENNDNGLEELEFFFQDVIQHFLNRTSQREKTAYRIYDIHKDIPKKDDELREVIPESYGVNRDLIPDETFVLVGFCKSEEHFKWIKRNKLYNTRTGTERGSLPLGIKETNSKYLLLHSQGETKTSKLFKLKNTGPVIFSKDDLIKKKYPKPSGKLYLVYKLEKNTETEFENMKWDITRLNGYKSTRGSALPFSVSLTELMKALVK